MVKRTILVLLFLTPFLLFSWDGVRGFEGGESVSEVKSRENTVFIDEKIEDDYAKLLYEDEVFSLPCSVLYEFYGGELDNIELYFGERYLGKLDSDQLTERVIDPLDDSNIFLNYMRYKYGNESGQEFKDLDRYFEYRYYWSFENLRIELICEKQYGNYESIRILYFFNDMVTPPASDFDKF